MAVALYAGFLLWNGGNWVSSKGQEFGGIAGKAGRLDKISKGSQCKAKSKNNVIGVSTQSNRDIKQNRDYISLS